MLYIVANKKFRSIRQLLSLTLAAALLLSGGAVPAGAAAPGETSLPAPGTRLSISPEFRPATLRGMRVDPAHPLHMEFLIDTGDDPQDSAEIAATNQRLINYFLTAVTVPEDQLWVNLSPEEAERIIADDLVKTEMGRDMLAMDYLLKQLMASMLYPEEGVGAEFGNAFTGGPRRSSGPPTSPPIRSIKSGSFRNRHMCMCKESTSSSWTANWTSCWKKTI